MSRWFRFYDTVLDDPKVQRLPGDLFKIWVNLLCVASRRDGNIPAEDVAFLLRMDERAAADALVGLHKAGLLDVTDTGMTPHNWCHRQFQSDTSAERTRKYRERHKNIDPDPDGDGGGRRGDGDVTSHVTAPDTDTDTDTDTDADTEQKEEEERAIALFPPDAFAQFWDLYPNKVGKQAAEAAFERVRKNRKAPFDTVMVGLRIYTAKTDDRPWCNPATWLNQGRWDDVPANVVPHSRYGPQSAKPSVQDVSRALEDWTKADERSSDVYPLLPATRGEPDARPARLLPEGRG